MIEETEKLKSASESKASHIADKLVPYTLGGTALTYLLTRNVTKALSVLMVDFSCALKLAMPITVLSAIREASLHNVTVKGGKFLEAVSEADTIVFDKTGTLTKAKPTVVDVVSFCDETPDELLGLQPALRNISLIQWQKQSLRQQNKNLLNMRRCTQRLIMLSLMEYPAILTTEKQLSEVIICL